jgi:acyl dehydratase
VRPLASGFVTSEFWIALAALAGKIVVLIYVLIAVSKTNPTDPNALITAISEVILAVGTIWGISHGAANYANNRTQLKTEAVRANAVSTRIIDTRVP